MMISSTPPDQLRAGLMSHIEGDRWILTLASSWRDWLPDDEDSFLEYARSLPQPDLYEAIKEAEPLSPVLNYKYSANRWRHYERMARLPEGFVILGDAVCSFNPVYGQGMTVAALEAKVLDGFLRQHHRGISNQERGVTQRFQKAITKVVEWPWQMATSADRPSSETQGELHWNRCLLDTGTRSRQSRTPLRMVRERLVFIYASFSAIFWQEMNGLPFSHNPCFLVSWLLFESGSDASLPLTNVPSAHLHLSKASLLVAAPLLAARHDPACRRDGPS
jgi:hypothetical protein